MRVRILFTFSLLALGLIPIVIPGAAQGIQPTAEPVPAGVTASPGATARWFIETVDPPLAVGSLESVAIDAYGTTFISYYDWWGDYVFHTRLVPEEEPALRPRQDPPAPSSNVIVLPDPFGKTYRVRVTLKGTDPPPSLEIINRVSSNTRGGLPDEGPYTANRTAARSMKAMCTSLPGGRRHLRGSQTG